MGFQILRPTHLLKLKNGQTRLWTPFGRAPTSPAWYTTCRSLGTTVHEISLRTPRMGTNGEVLDGQLLSQSFMFHPLTSN